MTIYSRIDKLFEMPPRRSRTKRRAGRRAPARHARRVVHPLENLEERLVLATLTVTDNTDNPDDTGSLRYAINHFASGDTIQFDASLAGKTIGLTEGQLDISQNVTIIGPAVDNQVAIDGLLQSRIFDIHSGNVQIFNLKIERGDAAGGNGGAILNQGTLTLGNSTVGDSMATGSNGLKGNSSANEGAGGGIYNSGTLKLVQSTISGNKSYGGSGSNGVDGSGGGGGGGAALGGGIFNAGTLDVVNSTISGNTAVGGGGGDFDDPGLTFGDKMGGVGGGNGAFNNTGSYANGYQSAGVGGGGAGGQGADEVHSNQNGTDGGFGGGGGGGGAYTLTGLFPSAAHGGNGGSYGGAGGSGGNSFDQYGGSGGAYSGGGGGGAGVGGGIFSQGTLTITSSTIADNSAAGGVGGSDGSATVKSPNAAGQPGKGVAGGIYIFDGTATLDSTIVAGNSVDGPGGGISPDARAKFLTAFGISEPLRVFAGTHNLIQDATGASGLSSTANLLNVNPLLLPLASNGGATETIQPQSGSPAIGAGDPQAVSPLDGSAVKVDQHGVPRHAQPDIGAVEHTTINSNALIVASTGGPYFVGGEQSVLYLSAQVSDLQSGHTVVVRWDVNGDGKPDAVATTTSNGSIVTAYATLTGAQLKALGAFNGSFLFALNLFTVDVTASDGSLTSAPATTTLTTERGPEGGLKNNGPVLVGQPVAAQIFVPSGASVQGPLHYSISLNQDDLATTYASAGTNDTLPLSFDAPGSYTAYGRMFQADGAFSDYTTTIDVYAAGQNNTMFVDRVYNDLFGRAGGPNSPDPGLAYWASQVQSGVSRQDVALAIMSDGGGEYDADLVQAAFQQYLHRAADPQALDYFVASLQAGLTAEQLDVDLVGSDEYFNTRGGGTNDGFLDALYEDALGRSADAGGRSSFDALLATSATRAQVADMVFGSPEYQHQLVNNMYELLLDRPADPVGLAGFTAELSAGLTDQQVMAQIIGSEEFSQRV
ncbi:MAG TPA: DUF4214 domain-containing protein [Pirellulales bacterium]|nr:DUF4214 domain-containing protein [Pirellulales bacterium]